MERAGLNPFSSLSGSQCIVTNNYNNTYFWVCPTIYDIIYKRIDLTLRIHWFDLLVVGSSHIKSIVRWREILLSIGPNLSGQQCLEVLLKESSQVPEVGVIELIQDRGIYRGSVWWSREVAILLATSTVCSSQPLSADDWIHRLIHFIILGTSSGNPPISTINNNIDISLAGCYESAKFSRFIY